MQITDVRVRVNQNKEGKLKGFASFVIDDAICVKDVKVLESERGLYIGMPSRKKDNGEYVDIVHPISQEARTTLTKYILDEYDKEVSK